MAIERSGPEPNLDGSPDQPKVTEPTSEVPGSPGAVSFHYWLSIKPQIPMSVLIPGSLKGLL